jgi:hypothetical protein
VVSVSSAPGGAGERVASIRSGDRVELIEKQGDESHVQLANGKDGWIKSSYLSAEEPLQRRLSERTAEVEKLEQDISRLQSDLATARSAPAPAAASATAGSDPPATATPVQDPAFFMSAPEASAPARPVWYWVVGSSLLTLCAGFALGWWMLDRRIRRKYGGLRIY